MIQTTHRRQANTSTPDSSIALNSASVQAGPISNRAFMEGVEILRQETPRTLNEILRCFVAIYARVSTDKEEQASSLKTQVEAFQATIASRHGWELTEVYADEGLSGTQASNRTEFMRMMADCEAGKVQYIITKSISRFARNTMECLQYVRRLKELGVYVYFDKEKLDTATATSEMLLSILAAAAQEESRSLSENLKWGYRKRFQAGQPKWVNTYGFLKGEDGEYLIHEEQAKGVRRIFDLCLSGHSLPQIAVILEQEGIPAMGGGKWWPKSVATVLHNEKYCGDVMMQKTYTIDHLSHKKVRNDRDVLPSYYVRDHHAAIVDRKTYELAQTILALNDRHLGSVQYPYGGILCCPVCGEKMVRFGMKAHGRPAAWTCGGRGDGRPSQCPPYAVKEKYIDQLVRDAYYALDLEQLQRLARKRDPRIAEAAEAALAWRMKTLYAGHGESHGAHPQTSDAYYQRHDTYSHSNGTHPQQYDACSCAQTHNAHPKNVHPQPTSPIFLDALVEKITFHKWSEGEVAWKFGVTTRMRVEYDKISDIPAAMLEYREDGFYWNGERVPQGRHVNDCLLNSEKNVKELRLAMAEAP